MNLDRHKQDWDDLAQVDLYWAILSDPARRDGGWVLEEFLESGRQEVASVLADIERLLPRAPSGSALDFGCGAGRLTRALGDRYDTATGVDISERMVNEARRINADAPNCDFVVGSGRGLDFGDDAFDLVYSSIVLQHLPDKRAILEYVAEFVRVTRPGGLAVFQVITAIPLRHRVQPRRRLYRLLRTLGVPPERLYALKLQPIAMTPVPEADVIRRVETVGGRVLDRQCSVVNGGSQSTVFYVSPQAG